MGEPVNERRRHMPAPTIPVDPRRVNARNRKTQRIRIGSITTLAIIVLPVAFRLDQAHVNRWLIAAWVSQVILAIAFTAIAAWQRRDTRSGQHRLDNVARFFTGLWITSLPFMALFSGDDKQLTDPLLLAVLMCTVFYTVQAIQYFRRRQIFTAMITMMAIEYAIVIVLLGSIGPALFVLAWCANAILILNQAARSRHELGLLADASFTRAQLDGLTAVLSRAGLLATWSASPRLPGPQSLIAVDIGRFTDINTAHGHQFGDQALRAFAERLVNVFGNQSTVARLYGDRFLILTPGTATAHPFIDDLNTKVARLREPFTIQGRTVSLHLRVGVSPIEPHESLAEAISDADDAVVAAKTRSNNRVVVFDAAMRAHRDRRRMIEARAPQALRNGEFEFWAQPYVQTGSLQPLGIELLCRWPQPDGSIIMPREFLPVLQAAGLLEELDRKALGVAAAWLRRWRHDDELGAIGVNVNVTAEHLASGVLHDVLTTFDREDTIRLGIELVENEVISQIDRIGAQIMALRSIGTRVILDDFGAGYAALSLLADLPLNMIKLDRSIISNVDTNERRRDLVTSIQLIAARLNINVLAEGIETPAELAVMTDLNVILSQGWLFGRAQPMPEADFTLRRLRREAIRSDPELVKFIDHAVRSHTAEVQERANATELSARAARRPQRSTFDPLDSDINPPTLGP